MTWWQVAAVVAGHVAAYLFGIWKGFRAARVANVADRLRAAGRELRSSGGYTWPPPPPNRPVRR